MHFKVFERINTGIVKLNDMEIRNCIYAGSLNRLVKELADAPEFKKAISLLSSRNRMQDRALILRFLAFYERTHLKCTTGLKKFLNKFFITYRYADDTKLTEYRKIFQKCMKASVTVFGDNAFKLKSDKIKLGSRNIGEWSSRPNAAIFQVISTSFAPYDLGEITQKADAIYEAYVDMIANDTLWIDRVRRATGETSRLSYTFEQWQTRLKQIMETTPPRGARLFSRQLKKEMFEKSTKCALCDQEIKLIDDAALDHDMRYWDGGRTIPENAQLVHRHCNASKG